MEEKRFIKCDGRIYLAEKVETSGAYSIKSPAHIGYDDVKTFMNIDSINNVTHCQTDVIRTYKGKDFVIKAGYYTTVGRYDLRIADEEVEDLLKSKRRGTNVAGAIDRLITELSYHPGLTIQGSEFLQAMDRQRDHFSESKKFDNDQ